jgi:sugar (pentulose or hexulose) kinase
MSACRHLALLLLLLYRTPFTFALSTSTSSSSMSTTTTNIRHFIGFDLGTSGARISVIQDSGISPPEDDASSLSASQSPPPFQEVYTQAIPWEGGAYDDPRVWMDAVTTLLSGAAVGLPSALDAVVSICVSGTSASCLLVDGNNSEVTRAPRMYNYDVVQSADSESSKSESTNSDVDTSMYGTQALALLDQYAPKAHTARSPTGSLAKLLAWNAERSLDSTGERLYHQADYIAMQLLSHDSDNDDNEQLTVSSDWHNCLKLGYDVRNLQWPEWIVTCLQAAGISDPCRTVLPATVVSPGAPMGYISSQAAKRFGLPTTVQIVGGTTDSNAAFFAATGSQPVTGTAVTSLGSTLAIKLIGSQYVEDASLGVYSHRFPSVLSNNGQEAWLVGGASNVGCAVLRQLEFSNDEIDRLSQEIDPATDSPLSYYPLTRKGERFPAADSNKEPVLEPVPDHRRDFLHGILQGISNVERDGFLALGSLGASPTEPVQVWTCGGGSRNNMWTSMRQRRLRQAFRGDNKVNVARAENTEASYGAALLAAASFQ